MDANDEELLEGSLMKKGSMLMGWRERHFVLSTLKLTYFTHPSKSTPKGSITLDSIKCINPLPEKKHGKKFCMAIISSTATWIVRADTESDFQRWTDAILAAINGLHKRSAASNNAYVKGEDEIRIPPLTLEYESTLAVNREATGIANDRPNRDVLAHEMLSEGSGINDLSKATPKASPSLNASKANDSKGKSAQRQSKKRDTRIGERRIED